MSSKSASTTLPVEVFDATSAPGPDTSEAEGKIVNAVRTIIAKATPPEKPQVALPTVIMINLGGGVQPLVAGEAGMIEVNFPCRILACHIFAGTASTAEGIQPAPATATIDLRLGSQGSWAGGSVPLYSGSSLPSITGVPEASLDVSTWRVNLQAGDLIPYWLATFSGPATWMTITLPVRRLDVRGIGVSSLTDSTTAPFVDTSGSPFVIRG